MRGAVLFILICGFVACKSVNSSEIRLRGYFGISQTEHVTVETIGQALNNQIPPKSSWEAVDIFTKSHGFGKDGLSECASVLSARTLRCLAVYFSEDASTLKKAYEADFEFDRSHGKLKSIHVSDIVVERTNTLGRHP